MPEKRTPDSLFVWYHAEPDSEAGIKQWLSDIFKETGIRGVLFVRHAEDKTTFMEIYENIGYGALETIEALATGQACFESVQRQCEAFERIHALVLVLIAAKPNDHAKGAHIHHGIGEQIEEDRGKRL